MNIGTCASVRMPCAIVEPNGPSAAFSGSVWIQYWSCVASANIEISSWVISCHSLCPSSSPSAASASANPQIGASHHLLARGRAVRRP